MLPAYRLQRRMRRRHPTSRRNGGCLDGNFHLCNRRSAVVRHRTAPLVEQSSHKLLEERLHASRTLVGARGGQQEAASDRLPRTYRTRLLYAALCGSRDGERRLRAAVARLAIPPTK